MHVLVIPSWYPSRSKPVNGMFFREQTVAWQKDSRSGGRVGIIYPRFLSWLEVFEPNWPSLGLDNFSDFGVDTFIHNKINWAPGWRARQRTRWTSAGIKLFERYTDQNGMPDLIHAHSILNGGYLAEQIAKRTGIPFVVTEHKTGFLKQDFFPPKILALIEKVAKKASARLAVSQGLGGQLERLLPAAGPWITVPNSVNSIFFEQALGSNPPTGGRGGGGLKLVSVGSLTRNKGYDLLIPAFKRSFKGAAGYQLEIIGEGPERGPLEMQIKNLGLSSRIKLLGTLPRNEVASKVGASDAFVSSSRVETFGVAIAEALALGKPVLATRCVGPLDTLGHHDGLLVDANNIDSLVDGLRSLERKLSKFFSEEIRARCFARFGEPAVNDQLYTVYSNILRSERAAKKYDG